MNQGTRPDRCPDDIQLQALLRQEMDDDDEMEIASHLSTCTRCQSRIEALAGMTSFPVEGIAAIAGLKTDEPFLEDLCAKIRADSPSVHAVDISQLLTPSPDPEVIGMFDDYEILEVVGHGGMGMVLKARDPSLNRIVAIKTLLPQMAISVSARERFLREAKNTAAVNHPNIVTIHSVDVRNGVPYIVMEFIDGRTLDQQIESGPIAEPELTQISLQIAEALKAAHACGLIHRDIKPANILLENGVPKVKVTDFGLSRAIDDTVLTRAGTVAGTPQFMSPEQADGKQSKRPSDMFSLGAVMYTMCTGQTPFVGESALAVMRQVCDTRPTPIRKLNPTIPPWIERIVESLLRKNPERRPSAADVVRMLSEGMSNRTRAVFPRAVGWSLLAAACFGICWFAFARGRLAKREDSAGGDVAASTSPADAVMLDAPLNFAVQRTGVIYPTFVAAVQAANSGDTIEVSGVGRMRTPEVRLIGKELVIEAAPGSAPVLVSQNAQGHTISTDASITLRGIGFEVSGNQRPAMQIRHSVLRCMGKNFRMENCYVATGNGVSAVGLGCDSAVFVDSYLASKASSGIVTTTWSRGTLELVNCLVECPIGVTAVIVDSGEGCEINVQRSTFVGVTAFRLTAEPNIPQGFLASVPDEGFLHITSTSSLFDNDYLFVNNPPRYVRVRNPLVTMERLISWHDSHSYVNKKATPAALASRRGITPIFSSDDAWQAWKDLVHAPRESWQLGQIEFGDGEDSFDRFRINSTEPPATEAVGVDLSRLATAKWLSQPPDER